MAIDVGNAAIDREFSDDPGTSVNRGNPANATGTIDTVEVWPDYVMSGVEYASFVDEGSNVLSTNGDTDGSNLGAPSDQKTTHTAVGNDFTAFAINSGEYIGLYHSSGYLELDTNDGGLWQTVGDDDIPASSITFSLQATYCVSLYATGTEAGGVTLTMKSVYTSQIGHKFNVFLKPGFLPTKNAIQSQITVKPILSVAGSIVLALKKSIHFHIVQKVILSVAGTLILSLKNAIQRQVAQKGILALKTILIILNTIHRNIGQKVTLKLKVFLVTLNTIHRQIIQKSILSVAGLITLALKNTIHRQIVQKLVLVVTGAGLITLTIKNAIHKQIGQKAILSVAGSLALAVKNAIHFHIGQKPILSVIGTITLALKNVLYRTVSIKTILNVTGIVALATKNAIKRTIVTSISLRLKVGLQVKNAIQNIRSLINSIIIKMKAAVGLKQFRTKAVIYHFSANAQTYIFKAKNYDYTITSKAA